MWDEKWQRRTGDGGGGGGGGAIGRIVGGNMVAMQRQEQWRMEVKKEGEKKDGGLR